jgi:hypothetical protein
VELTLADLRGADSHTPLTEAELPELQQVLTFIPDGDRMLAAKARLAFGEVITKFDFGASLAQPVLADDPPDAVLTTHPDWLISTLNPVYIQALASYLAVELAPLDPAITVGIVRRADDGLADATVQEIAAAIARRMLAEPRLKMQQTQIIALTRALTVYVK